nr:Tm-1-like ATP-binding domain-containing protein [uncultured Celeribacter sp.]
MAEHHAQTTGATRPKVLMIVTQDTKREEAAYLRATLEGAGVDVIHLDPSVRKVVGGAEIGPEEVAAATGKTLEEVRAIHHEGKILDKMIEGAVACALAVHEKTPISGILSIGGSMGTTMGTTVMRAFPYGMPKMMISTLASGMTAGFVGVKDICMLNSVCDISGLNSISHDVYRNGALAVAGMAMGYEPIHSGEKPLVLVSTLGTTEACSRRVREGLEADGFEVMVFHTTGNGGRTLETICAERDVAAVVDMSLVEINDFLRGGMCAVGPDRAATAVQKGIPVVFAPGNVDFYIMPSQHAVGAAPFEGRGYHVHNSALTAVRTTEEDLMHLADHLAEIIKDATGPVRFFVPRKGFSHHDSPDGPLPRPNLPPVFEAQCKEAFGAAAPVVGIDSHINDSIFADALLTAVREVARAPAMA